VTEYYSEAEKGPHAVFGLGDFELEGGAFLQDARLLYKTHGTLSPARDNAVLYPHMYSGTPSSLESTIAPGRALDPDRWFVICPGQLGNGFSSSPSNTAGRFPDITIGDDVRAQHRLVTETLGIERLALAVGFSMGAQQAYEWAVRHPSCIERLAVIAGTARTTPHNALCVLLAEQALATDGLELHARAWVPVGLSHELFRTEAWREAGFSSPDDLVERLFVEDFAPMDAGNLLCQCRKWRHADVSRHGGGDLAAALSRITAKTFVIPFSHDMLFPVEDCDAERRLIPGAELHVLESFWGHYAFEITEAARIQLDAHLRDLLDAAA
jgi:homoserine O-acetyltransferase/O-succinyltransferase